MEHGNRETAVMRPRPRSYGKWRGSSVRKRRRELARRPVSARNRIKASPAERVAAQHSPQRRAPCHRSTPWRRYGDHGIFRACRLKAACTRDSADGMQQRRDPAPVDDQAFETSARRLPPFLSAFSTVAKILDTSSCNPANSAVSTVRRGCSTTSTSRVSKARFRRTASRMRRLMRLRSTALPRTRPAVRPTRGPKPEPDRPLGEEICHRRREVFTAPLINTLIVSVLAQPRIALGKKSQRRIPRSPVKLVLVAVAGTHGNALAALGAAAGKHCCPCLGFHPGQKAVSLRPMAAVRLECALGHNTALLISLKNFCLEGKL